MTELPQPIEGFDCVQFMRDARARINAETEGMTSQELLNWLDSRQYEDTWLQKMAERARARRREDTAANPLKKSAPM